VESVRAMRNSPLTGEAVTVSAADPLNLVGILVPGERVAAISGRSVTYRDGVAQDAVAQDGVPQSIHGPESSGQQQAAAG
jgi:ATP-dependent Lhr-like helicase